MSWNIAEPIVAEDADDGAITLNVGHVVYATTKDSNAMIEFIKYAQRTNFAALNHRMATHPNMDKMAPYLATAPMLTPTEIL